MTPEAHPLVNYIFPKCDI